MTQTNFWTPVFPKQEMETLISLRNQTATMSMSGRQVIIAIIDDVEHDSPACFWVNPNEVYLRMNWCSWYKVSTDNTEITAALGQRNAATLTYVVNNVQREYSMPVYRIDHLPENIFAESISEGTVRSAIDRKFPVFITDLNPGNSHDAVKKYQQMIEQCFPTLRILRKFTDKYNYKLLHNFTDDRNNNFVIIDVNHHYLLINLFNPPYQWQSEKLCFDTMDDLFGHSSKPRGFSPLADNLRMRRKLERAINRKICSLILFDDTNIHFSFELQKRLWDNLRVLLCYTTKPKATRNSGYNSLKSVVSKWKQAVKKQPVEDDDSDLIIHGI